MIARVHKSMDEKDRGFTLIELLVVIIIIGILSAIAIPVFLNQRKKAVDASIKSDLRTIANEYETYFTDAQTYPAPAEATQAGGAGGDVTVGTSGNTVSVSQNNAFTARAGDANEFCIQITNAGGTDATNGFFYASADGGLQPAGTTACP